MEADKKMIASYWSYSFSNSAIDDFQITLPNRLELIGDEYDRRFEGQGWDN